jgi:hypothetical protein
VTAGRLVRFHGPCAVLALAALALVAACQSSPTGPADTGPPRSPGATVSGPESFGPPPTESQPADSTPVVLDPTLLGVLPEAVSGIPIREAVDEAAAALQDASLPRVASAIDAGVAVDAAHGDLVYALVVRLKPGAFTAELFRQWRDSFDEGACAASGGVVGHAQRTIDQRTVFITSCAVGMRTYHLWLEADDLLISASSVGEGNFGERLIDDLRVPA